VNPWCAALAAACAAAALAGGCGPKRGSDAGAASDGGGGSTDAGGGATDSGGAACGTEAAPVASIGGTEGLAIAPDGTVYYSQYRAVGRRLPGAAPEDAWVALAGADTVWGMALAADGMLYVGSPSTGVLYSIDTTAAVPVAQTLDGAAGNPNGVAMGPDGAVYYGDFNTGRVYRVTPAGARTEVTASPVPSANGLLFDADGTLLVLDYFDGTIFRLTLDASMQETGRVMAGAASGNAVLDGIARDDLGRYYVTDNGNGALLRFDAAFGAEETLLTGLPAAANVAFGKGALRCTDVYVASSGSLGLFNGDSAGTP
jgi:virginiamycin B lyase